MKVDALMQNVFRRVPGCVWDFATGRVGVRQRQALVTLEKSGRQHKLVRNPMDFFSTKIPAYAILTPIADLQPGDLMVIDPDKDIDATNNLGFFIKATGVREDADLTNASLKLLELSGQNGEYAVADNPIMATGVMAVKTVLSMGNGGGSNMLPFLLLMKGQGMDSKDDLGKFFAMMTLFGGGSFGTLFGPRAETGEDPAQNPLQNMLPLILFSGSGEGGNSFVHMLLMSQMMGGGKLDMTKLAPLLAMQSRMGGEGGLLGGLFSDEESASDDDEEEDEEDEEEEVPSRRRR